VVLLCALSLTTTAYAHPVPFSYIDLHLRQAGVELQLTVHVFDLAHDLNITPMERLLQPVELRERAQAIRELLSPRLQVVADGRKLEPEWGEPEILAERQSVRFQIRYPDSAIPGVIAIHTVMFPYEPEHQTFLNVYEYDALASQAILDVGHPDTEYFTGSRQGLLGVARKFVPAGVHHILIGPDHLLFLVGLLLLGGTLKRLALVVTSFTIAHSITLTLAALNVLSPPSWIIEPAIALSIVYVGLDNLLKQEGRDMRAWIALTFGLIHGFGFASVLREMGLPARALGTSLFSFNLGVEVGQLMVVVVVATALAALRSRSELAGRRIVLAGSIVVIAAGAFWFVQRVFFSGGVS